MARVGRDAKGGWLRVPPLAEDLLWLQANGWVRAHGVNWWRNNDALSQLICTSHGFVPTSMVDARNIDEMWPLPLPAAVAYGELMNWWRGEEWQ